ncbi:MAG: hypothetical protein AB7E71_05450 [Dongiaceae bacterium]
MNDGGDFDSRRDYPAEKARQGDIVLRHRWSRAIFLAALALIVIAVLLSRLL